MVNPKLQIESQPARQDIDFLEDQLVAFNVAQTGYNDGQLLACFIRDDEGVILGGIYGWTWGGCCEIRYLWVHESLRRLGYGSHLLRTAEQAALERGCSVMVLDTHSFQAPQFYQKMGYKVVGAAEDYPRGYRRILLEKRLSEE